MAHGNAVGNFYNVFEDSLETLEAFMVVEPLGNLLFTEVPLNVGFFPFGLTVQPSLHLLFSCKGVPGAVPEVPASVTTAAKVIGRLKINILIVFMVFTGALLV